MPDPSVIVARSLDVAPREASRTSRPSPTTAAPEVTARAPEAGTEGGATMRPTLPQNPENRTAKYRGGRQNFERTELGPGPARGVTHGGLGRQATGRTITPSRRVSADGPRRAGTNV
jgi:hypothetical protein